MNNKIVLVLVIVLFAGAYFAGKWLQTEDSEQQSVRQQMQYAECSPALQDCIAFIQGRKLVIRFLQPPSALKPFTVQLSIDELQADSVRLEFFMKDMDMGVNRYSLEPVDEHSWSTRVILPVCSLGRHDWVSRFEVVYGNQIWVADFDFQQVGN